MNIDTVKTITNANASPRATVLVGLLRSLFDTKKKMKIDTVKTIF